MIAYRLLRAFGRLALRWFYRGVEVVGAECLPDRGPVLLASNHPNALVDALVIGCTLDRPVTLTAKATLLDNPVTRALLRVAGVVPLRRASDEAARADGTVAARADGTVAARADGTVAYRPTQAAARPDPSRNAHAFAAVLDVLQRGGAVLLFPEGKSHSDPALAPLRTGLARIALMARDERRLQVPIIPVGLTFERKWEPRSRVLMQIGTPIVADASMPNATDGVASLTERVDIGLRLVTLNFRSDEHARQTLALAHLLAKLLDEFRPLGNPDPPLAERARLAQRIAVIRSQLTVVDGPLVNRVDRFVARLSAFEESTRAHGIAVNDVQMNTGVGPGAWFVVREVLIAVLAGPLALWGRLNHWVPLRLARWIALRTSQTPDEPAMQTIVAGLVLVLAFYGIQTAAVAWLAGWIAAVVYAVSLPISATWDFRYADRRQRATARTHTYLRFRRAPELQSRLVDEAVWLRSEAVSLNATLEEQLAETPPTEPTNAGEGVLPVG